MRVTGNVGLLLCQPLLWHAFGPRLTTGFCCVCGWLPLPLPFLLLVLVLPLLLLLLALLVSLPAAVLCQKWAMVQKLTPTVLPCNH